MLPALPMMLVPLTVNSELSPPTDAPVNVPDESTATSRVNDCGEVLVLTTVSWLDEVVVCADRNLVTPLRFDVRIADSVPLSSTSSFFSLKDRPRSLIVSPPTVPV